MKKIPVVLLVLLVFTGSVYAAKPPRCSDVPISITFLAPANAQAAISNDDPTKSYQSGTGITNTVIHLCGGSHDATFLLESNSSRRVRIKLPAAIAGSTAIESGPASFAGGNEFLTTFWMNIRNIVGQTVIPSGVSATYYTRVATQFVGPDGKTYRLIFYPDTGACPGDYPCVPDLHGNGDPDTKNDPMQTAWVKVTSIPRNRLLPWSSSNTDSWIVEGDVSVTPDTEIQRGTLFYVPRKGPAVHSGQYSMPFKISVTALAALP